MEQQIGLAVGISVVCALWSTLMAWLCYRSARRTQERLDAIRLTRSLISRDLLARKDLVEGV